MNIQELFEARGDVRWDYTSLKSGKRGSYMIPTADIRVIVDRALDVMAARPSHYFIIKDGQVRIKLDSWNVYLFIRDVGGDILNKHSRRASREPGMEGSHSPGWIPNYVVGDIWKRIRTNNRYNEIRRQFKGILER